MKTAQDYAEEATSIAIRYEGREPELLQAALVKLFEQACAKPRQKISQPVDTSPVVLVFNTKGKEATWNLTQAMVDIWKAAFPGVDVVAECRKAGAWMESNPARRKTSRGMTKFLYDWIARSNDRGAIPRQFTGARPSGPWNDYKNRIKAGEQG